EIRSAFLILARAMAAQATRDMGPRVNANEGTMASKLRDFVRMNPPVFLGSKVGEDPQELLDEVYKVVSAMGVTSKEKAELASYQLKDVAQIWFTQWKANRLVGTDPIEWEEFKEAFLGKYFPLEKRECKIEEFINLRQGNMSVEEYALKFSMLSRYAPSLVSNSREEMSRFVTGESDLVKEECRTAMLHGDMNISRLFVYAQSIEESKMTRLRKDLKRGRYED
ncbi:retrotransposon gag domain-containing protein, partial [Salmonella enterica]|nr:retrotransposon gag domain-containing protein [Salmonella enterica]